MTTAERRKHFLELGDAMRSLNPYKQKNLRAAFVEGFTDSFTDNDRIFAFRGNERIAYGRGWNARRDVDNVATFPVIEIR